MPRRVARQIVSSANVSNKNTPVVVFVTAQTKLKSSKKSWFLSHDAERSIAMANCGRGHVRWNYTFSAD